MRQHILLCMYLPAVGSGHSILICAYYMNVVKLGRIISTNSQELLSLLSEVVRGMKYWKSEK